MSDDVKNVECMDPAKKNSNLIDSLQGEKTAIFGEDKTRCFWNDEEFAEEDLICGNGVVYKCNMGIWVRQDREC